MTLFESIAATETWFAEQNWTVFDFQKNTWRAWHDGHSGLVHSPTGSGKTLAAWLGPLQGAMLHPEDNKQLKVLWITPLRALANDTLTNLRQAADALQVPVEIDIRTGDTSSSRRSRQRKQPPFALITTPESLSVMLSYPGAEIGLCGIETIVVDEWHELMGSKRGVQLQLCLARLKQLCKPLRIWGVSATLANLDEAMTVLLGPNHNGQLIQDMVPREIHVDSLLPQSDVRFKWSGHVGLQLIEPVIKAIASANTTLVFTNTRSQAEIWFQALLEAQPQWLHKLALHHGSLDRELRNDIEDRLRDGLLQCVVCTSSLDLGVDFSPVDQVLQIGSPKGVARLLQRAGRSGHRPGAQSKILCVPTNVFELVEIAAVREAIENRNIEGREPPKRSLDVLCQHLVTIAMGSGFVASDMLAEIKTTHCFSDISDEEWNWVLDFITRGGQALQGYAQYRKVQLVTGVYRVMNKEIQTRHRMSIGTISSDAQIMVTMKGGKRLGTTEENFIARLRQGDTFHFAGHALELISVKDMTAYVKKATRKSRAIPRWWGTQMPLSSELSDSVLDTLHRWKVSQFTTPELHCIDDVLQLQLKWSHLPSPQEFLIEHVVTQEGHSLFFYPFAGRLAHEGLAMVVALRLAEISPCTFTLQINDYGFELQTPDPLEIDIDVAPMKRLFSADNLLEDILRAINTSEIAKRRFRDIARIAGLVFDGFPGRVKSVKHVQASSGLIYDVLKNYDEHNLLLEQSRREVLELQLDYQRLSTTLAQLSGRRWILKQPGKLTPLSFPLWSESLNSQTMSTLSFQERIQSVLGTLEKAAAETLEP